MRFIEITELFGQGALDALDESSLAGALSELPQAAVTAGAIGSIQVAQLLVDAGLTKSLGEARRAIAQGGFYINNEAVAAEDAVLGASHLLYERFAVLRRGKKTLAAILVG